jgi:hypothetical protein
MYIKFNQLDGALRWLNSDWDSHFEQDRLQLLENEHVNVDIKADLIRYKCRVASVIFRPLDRELFELYRKMA